MKIAYIFADRNVPVLGSSSGASIHIREMCRALAGLGNSIVVLAGRRGEGASLQSVGGDVHQLMPEAGAMFEVSRLHTPSLRGPLTTTLSWGAVGHDIARQLWSTFWDRKLYCEARAIIEQEKPDILYERYVGGSKLGRLLARKFSLPLIVEFNSSLTFSDEWWHRHSPLFPWLMRLAEEKYANAADRFVVVASPLREYLVELGVPDHNVTIVPDGADPDRFRVNPAAAVEVRARHGLNGSVVIGFIGSLRRFHDLDTVLDAIRIVAGQLPRMRFLIVGDGPQRTSLEERVASYGLEANVVFAGQVPHEAVPAYINCMDVALVSYPATHNHSSPLKLFEYMAAGRAIVASRTSLDGAITSQEGVIVDPGDAPGMANAILLLAHDADLRHRLGERAHMRFMAKFTWAANAAKVLDLCEETIRGRTASRSISATPA